jgi:hypothetical protein
MMAMAIVIVRYNQYSSINMLDCVTHILYRKLKNIIIDTVHNFIIMYCVSV